MNENKTSIGFEQNVAAMLSYLIIWISGLIIFLIERENKFVRFHALQSTITFLIITIINIILGGFSRIPIVGFIFGILLGVVGLLSFILWIVGIIFSVRNEIIKFPIIGDIAESIIEKKS
ncbi:MAG TPA: DUF4870 domain-containing protein [Spirochaetota bacterium]|nr:DUF4870 domain-containing protein [Spirochaetota bacterium]